MQAVLQVPVESIYADLPVFAVLAVWNLFVLLVLSKKVYEFALKKGRSTNSSMYFSGKEIKDIAELLGRRRGGIRARLKKLGIISNDANSTRKNVKDEIKYSVKNEHPVENNLYEDDEKSRSIKLNTEEENVEDLKTLPIIQESSIRSAFRKLRSFFK